MPPALVVKQHVDSFNGFPARQAPAGSNFKERTTSILKIAAGLGAGRRPRLYLSARCLPMYLSVRGAAGGIPARLRPVSAATWTCDASLAFRGAALIVATIDDSNFQG